MWTAGAAARGVTVKLTGCGFDPHSTIWNIYLNLYFHFFALVSRQSAALSSATQHTMPPESGRKWGMEYLNTRFPLPTLLCAGYSANEIFLQFRHMYAGYIVKQFFFLYFLGIRRCPVFREARLRHSGLRLYDVYREFGSDWWQYR